VKTLKRGDPSRCKPTEVVERKCKAASKINGKLLGNVLSCMSM